jgi:hypothetical protein
VLRYNQPASVLVEVVCVVEGGVIGVIDSLGRQKAARALPILGQASWRGLSALYMNMG